MLFGLFHSIESISDPIELPGLTNLISDALSKIEANASYEIIENLIPNLPRRLVNGESKDVKIGKSAEKSGKRG